MKNLFAKIFFIFAFILNFIPAVYAGGQLSVTSVTFDNSAAFLSINSAELEDYQPDSKTVLHINPETNRLYFDLSNANLKCNNQYLAIKSDYINEINVYPSPENFNSVRVEIAYNQGFNPKSIHLKKSGNTLFVQFKYPGINNYYFQGISSDTAAPQTSYDNTQIQIKVPDTSTNVNLLGQINASFNQNSANDEYVFTDKNILLKTKYSGAPELAFRCTYAGDSGTYAAEQIRTAGPV